MSPSRKEDLDQLYGLLCELESRLNGKRVLDSCHGRMGWPERGVYFFFSADKERNEDGALRVTRVGTHAVSRGSGTTLWGRLRTHRGPLTGKYPDGGNHRGSIFRLRVGEALREKYGLHEEYPDWGRGSSAGRDIRQNEYELEQQVSAYIREMPFLWVKIVDAPASTSRRAYIERNAIALLSNYNKPSIDERAGKWLGNYSPVVKIRKSGLWNSNHVDEEYDPMFLDELERYIAEM